MIAVPRMEIPVVPDDRAAPDARPNGIHREGGVEI
jgi:hypothetical protein